MLILAAFYLYGSISTSFTKKQKQKIAALDGKYTMGQFLIFSGSRMINKKQPYITHLAVSAHT